MTIADIRVGLRAYLIDDAAVAAVAGARVYSAVFPQGIIEPTVVFHRVSGLGDYHMLGPSGISRPRFQIDCWAQTIDAAVTLANLVKDRIDGFRGTWLWGEDSPAEGIVIQGVFYDQEREMFDNDMKMFLCSRDYLIWHAER